MKTTKKKRTITPEHLAKMQEGKKKAQRHRERMKDIDDMSKRMRDAKKNDKITESILQKRIKKRH